MPGPRSVKDGGSDMDEVRCAYTWTHRGSLAHVLHVRRATCRVRRADVPRATCYVPSAACGRATCDVLCARRATCDVLCARRATCDVLYARRARAMCSGRHRGVVTMTQPRMDCLGS